MFKLEVLGAKHGDCLIIHYDDEDDPKRILIDGGPGGVYENFLRPRLMELKDADPDKRAPVFELAMISHIDDDHINGLLDLTKEMVKEKDSGKAPATIKKFWHNSFQEITGSDTEPTALASVSEKITASVASGSSIPFDDLKDSDGRAEHILASVNQGRKLRDRLIELGIQGNAPFGNTMAMQGKSADLPGGMKIDIIGPDKERLTDLRDKWSPDLTDVEIAKISDRSVSNLASICCVVRHSGKTILLTGDARSDDVIDWLKATGNLEGGKAHFDVVKMPHHGSSRNVDENFFKTVTGDIYVYCADGHHGNPDPETIDMMRTGLGGRKCRMILSNEVKKMDKSATKLAEFRAELKKLERAGVTIETRPDDELSVMLTLA